MSDSRKSITQPLPYTSSPALLALQDLYLFFKLTFTLPPTGLPSIVLPITPLRSGALDELYPSPRNIFAVFIHIILIVAQSTFIILLVPSIFTGLPVPLLAFTPTSILLVTGFVVGNTYFCILLNGTKRYYQSIVKPEWKERNEKWIFINGVAVGDGWMQANIDRLALTFQRPVAGIHNRTRGIIFDVVETIVQRTFGYATPDVREVYASILGCLEAGMERGSAKMRNGNTESAEMDGETAGRNEQSGYDKIVLILHSQGAVEGGLVLDWLYATLDQTKLAKLEVYTFGSAANHFNAPTTQDGRVVRWIEHYANLGDYVARFGILHFRPLPKIDLMKSRGSGGVLEGLGNGTMQGDGKALMMGKGSGMMKGKKILDDQNGAGTGDADNPAAVNGFEPGSVPANDTSLGSLANKHVEGYTSHEARVEIEDRYVGRLFVRKGSGHQMNGNYLDSFFTMGMENGKLTEVLENNDFMSSEVNERILDKYDIVSKASEGDYWLEQDESLQKRCIKDMSRLWQYRNGRSPDDDGDREDGRGHEKTVQKND